MARRIVRTIIQFAVLSIAILAVVFFLDLRYRLLPQSIHHFLPEHHAGKVVTDVTYISCSRLQLLSKCGLEANEGWIKINKDVFLGQHWISQGYVHIKLKREEEFSATAGDRVVVDIKAGRLQPQLLPTDKEDAKWESRPGGLWIKRQSKLVDDAVTAVDILYGADAVEVRPGWRLREGTMLVAEGVEVNGAKIAGVKITARNGPAVPVVKPVLRMRKDHKFKIIQVSDMHLSTGVGKCRDALPAETADSCEADPRTLEFIAKILDDEKPDLAILSGDQVNGETSPDAQTAIFKFAEVFINRKIPYATILGNHDDEGNLSREQVMKITEGLPYSLSEVGPELGAIITDKKGRQVREGGVGNYLIEVLANKNDHSAITIYMMDTHSYSPQEKTYHGYDWIKPSQISWFKHTHASLKQKHEQYTYLHLDMAFIHIPLPEYRPPNPPSVKNKDLPMVGAYREPSTASNYNSKFTDALLEAGVGVVSAGHDHVNDYCLLHTSTEGENKSKAGGVWLCYAGGSGFGGYGGWGGYHRRVRLWEVDAPADRITTWKRVEHGVEGRVDSQVVIEGGRVVAP
ncbi:Phosphatase dcr2 [Rhizina undulata]